MGNNNVSRISRDSFRRSRISDKKCLSLDERGKRRMIYLRLFFEFCKVGLFAVGGGLATIPFLSDLGNRTGWFTSGQLADMIAVSESTPGPIGVNIATYAGFTAAGVPGGIVSTLGLVFPSLIIILIIAGFLNRFRESVIVDSVFYGLRAASAALITAALLQVAEIALMNHVTNDGNVQLFYWPAVILAAAVFVCFSYTPLKKIHPIFFIAFSAVVGIVLGM
jgi:chromate transporter